MLTIRRDPHGLSGQDRYPWDFGRTIQQNIEAHLASGYGCELVLNGIKVDPLQCPDLDRPPTIADAALVISRPEGLDPITWIYIAIAATVISYALMPKIPGAQTQNESPNNRLTAQTNIARAYQGIPDVYGTRRVWPDLIQPSVIEYIDHTKYVTETLCISRGAGTVSAVQYADTPILDVAGATYEIFEPVGTGYPESLTTTVPDVVEEFATPDVDGQEISNTLQAVTSSGTYSNPGPGGVGAVWTFGFVDGPEWDFIKNAKIYEVFRFQFLYDAGGTIENADITGTVYYNQGTTEIAVYVPGEALTATSGTTTITVSRTTIGPFSLSIECDHIKFNTKYPRGLDNTVSIDVELWAIDGSGNEISGSHETVTIDHSSPATQDERAFTNRIEPAYGMGKYRVQFRRTTPDNDWIAKLEGLFAVRTYATKTFPGVTIARIRTRATQAATGFRERKFNLRFSRKVRTLTNDTLSASSNAFRIMAHIWTLAGNDIAELDSTAMQSINTALGENSALLRFDGSLDDADMSLGERMQTVANHARCLLWRDGTKWTVTRDQAKNVPDCQLDYRNLSAAGDGVISVASHMPASRDGVEVEYTDPYTQATKAYKRLNITTGAPIEGACQNPLKIKLQGCVNDTQAMNRAQLEARKLIYQRTSVTDEVLSDGGVLGPGSLVRWIDPADFYGDDGLQAGEVLAIAGSIITTSEPLQWHDQTSGRMLFTNIQGATIGPVVVTPGAADNLAVLATVPTGIYTAGAGAQLGSRYAFGPGLTADEIQQAGLFTVTGIKPASNGKAYTLELAQYDQRIYAAD